MAAVPSVVPPAAKPGASRTVRGGGGGGGDRWLNRFWRSVPEPRPRRRHPGLVGKGATYRPGSQTTGPRPPSSGPSPTFLTASVELSTTFVASVNRWTRRERRLPRCHHDRPTNPTSPSRWQFAHSQIKGRFQDYITPPLENIEDLPREPPSRRWQQLPNDMGKVNIGLVDEATRSTLVIIIFTGSSTSRWSSTRGSTLVIIIFTGSSTSRWSSTRGSTLVIIIFTGRCTSRWSSTGGSTLVIIIFMGSCTSR